MHRHSLLLRPLALAASPGPISLALCGFGLCGLGFLLVGGCALAGDLPAEQLRRRLPTLRRRVRLYTRAASDQPSRAES